MQVGCNVTCMHTNFGGHSLSGFGDIATFKKQRNVTCMYTNFGGCSFLNFEDIATFKNSRISHSDYGL